MLCPLCVVLIAGAVVEMLTIATTRNGPTPDWVSAEHDRRSMSSMLRVSHVSSLVAEGQHFGGPSCARLRQPGVSTL
ncbi:hypothetical protein C7974DRAFT_394781 [Boeremia exigua]|uniref:uncharacterized protein n=1 Tax=Boeremia exigua TaxID=749465 RepID=UPI001E8CC4D7|nr:uncharacterized protein C7974DRAFT_394781 [Boeremia exigua]KAH6629605.1 hypothetical protein C7974DRAFT_394781 [Boeremia exigua]